jgi:hypothetical protein
LVAKAFLSSFGQVFPFSLCFEFIWILSSLLISLFLAPVFASSDLPHGEAFQRVVASFRN